jgi:diguanylate cyclase (GGDEF)-like protein
VQKPAQPTDETQRLRALQGLCVLDTLPEERFDRITRLAARLFEVPIALVSLVDRDRQWFKSRQGLDAPETGRDVSFCGHAILRAAPLIVPDSLADPRFAGNPLVTGGPGVRFYAGHPVHAPDGSRVGTLCLIDRRPREFSAEDAAALADLAQMVDRELALVTLATIDELTHLSNRRGLTDIASRVLALCRRQGVPATLVAIDLDGFKQINDRCGHAAGDVVLQKFADLLLKHFRDSDVIGRLGGDEFCVLAGGATAAQVQASLERLQAGFGHSALGKAHPGLAWSAGIVEFDPASSLDLDALLEAADQRMYRAKCDGRGRRDSAVA